MGLAIDTGFGNVPSTVLIACVMNTPSMIVTQELAAAVGSPKAVRAAGLANGQNPVAVIVPCHRVIGANGTLTGYAGGLERKRWLLAHEGVVVV